MTYKIVHYDNIINDFWWFVNERQEITERKNLNHPWPWTTDEILQNAYINNIDRSEDSGTKFLLSTLNKLPNISSIYLIVLYRFTGSNRNVLQAFLDRKIKDHEGFRVYFDNKPIFNSSAYQRPCFPKGTGSGRDFILNILHKVCNDINSLLKTKEYWTVKDLTEAICEIYPKYSFNGIPHNKYKFHTNEICKDLSYIYSKVDTDAACHIGPGAVKGLEVLFPNETVQDGFKILKEDPRFKDQGLNDDILEGALCEFRKYLEYKQGKPIKRRYSIDQNKKGYIKNANV